MTRPDGKVSHDKAVLILDQHGTMLSGSAGATVDQQTAFTSGVAENGEVRFHLDAAGGMDFTLHRSAGRLKGTVVGTRANAEVDVQPAPGLLPQKQLEQEIVAADKQLFEAFSACDAITFARFFSKDLEFYHDHTGRTSYDENLIALKNRCAEGIRLRRELVEGSLIVNAVPGFGAIEAGQQRFYAIQPDGSEHLDATALFTDVWSKTSGDWKLVRVISYDHR